jgi:hypothetical protein
MSDDYLVDIESMLERELEENWLPTWQLRVMADAWARLARAKQITDIQGFAQTVRSAITLRIGDGSAAHTFVPGATAYTNAILNDLRRVLIGDGWTNQGRNHGQFALGFEAFLDTGFKPEFRDGGNQVQHAMAGIYIRCVDGLFASKVPYWMEDEEPDLALYRAAFEIGDLLAFSRPIGDLPDLILARLGV